MQILHSPIFTYVLITIFLNICLFNESNDILQTLKTELNAIMNFRVGSNKNQHGHSYITGPTHSTDPLFLPQSKKRNILYHIMSLTNELHWVNPQQGPLPAPVPASYQDHQIQPSIPINYGLQLLFSPNLAFSTVVTPICQNLPLHSTNVNGNNSITTIREIIHQTNIVTKENPPNILQASVLSQYFQTDELGDAAIVIQLSQTLTWNRILPKFVVEKDEYKSQRPQLTIKAATLNILTSLCYYFANDCHKMSCNRNNTTIETCKNTIKKNKMKRMAKFFIHYYGRLSLGSPWELKIVEQDILTRNYNSVVDFFNRKSKQGMFSIRYLGDVNYNNKPINGNVIKGMTIHHWDIVTKIYYNLGVNKTKIYLLHDEQLALAIPTAENTNHQGDPDAIMQEYEEYYRDATAAVQRCFDEHKQPTTATTTATSQTNSTSEEEPPLNKTAL